MLFVVFLKIFLKNNIYFFFFISKKPIHGAQDNENLTCQAPYFTCVKPCETLDNALFQLSSFCICPKTIAQT